MNYKVGDKVLIEMVIDDFDETSDDFWVSLKRDEETSGMWLTEKQITKYTYKDNSKTYEDGLNDAWELARKLVLSVSDGGISIKDFEIIFGAGLDYKDILKIMTPQQALAKIEAYEESKVIKVGDVVYCPAVDSKEGICVGRGNDGQEYALVWFKEYSCPQNISLKDLKKTGRHIDISHLLEQIRG